MDAGHYGGSDTATASVGDLTATFTAKGSPAAAANLVATPDPVPDGYIGTTVPLSATVTDAYGNVRPGDAVTWTVTGGGGSVSGDALTDATGSAAATWTLGNTPGTNAVLVNAGGLTHTFQANAICRDGWGTATVDGSFDAGEWVCADSEPFAANLSGGSTPAVMYWMNDGTRLYLAVRVTADVARQGRTVSASTSTTTQTASPRPGTTRSATTPTRIASSTST